MKALLAGLLLGIAACGGHATPGSAPTPANGARTLTAMDPDLSPIAKAAARSLEKSSDGKVRFSGVFVGGREQRALSDTIARMINAEYVSVNDRRVPYTIGKLGSGENAEIRRDATYTLINFRVAGDTAFVGADARSAQDPEGALCIMLSRSGSSWLIMKTSVIRNPKFCGG